MSDEISQIKLILAIFRTTPWLAGDNRKLVGASPNTCIKNRALVPPTDP